MAVGSPGFIQNVRLCRCQVAADLMGKRFRCAWQIRVLDCFGLGPCRLRIEPHPRCGWQGLPVQVSFRLEARQLLPFFFSLASDYFKQLLLKYNF